MRWPDTNGFAAEAFAQVLAHTTVAELARRLGIDEAQVHRWRIEGVPTGGFAALLRYWARDNGVSLYAPSSNVKCLLCGAPSSVLFADVPVCDFCHEDPTAAGEALGFRFGRGQYRDGFHVWFGVESPEAFEFPAAAVMRPQEDLWFSKPDVEIGHPDFDDAVRIETDDYESLFDLLQHRRRRQLALVLATQLRLKLNVDAVYAIVPTMQEIRENRVLLALLLLAWSLTYDRANPMEES